jgi:uncharacterized protein (DUF1800 family)
MALALLAFAASISAQSLPYAQAGLSQQRAVEVLLDRFTYGATPEQVQQVLAEGMERWFERQLQADGNESELKARLSKFPAVDMTHQQLFATFPSGAQSTAHARRFYDLVPPADTTVDSEWRSRKLAAFRREQGYLSQETDLYQQLTGQKIVRAVYAQNQLAEVVADFWSNHFYATSSNFRVRPWVMAYEKEAIRPHALGDFRTLLIAAAKHPAKIQATAGDAQKTSVGDAETTMGLAFARLQAQGRQTIVDAINKQLEAIATQDDLLLQRRFWPATGPNLEFSRLLFQQTLGSNGVYEQQDVEDAARVFTGWSTLPYGVNDQWFAGGFTAAGDAGFIQEGSFVFRADQHDATTKRIFGRRFATGGGYDEGVQLLEMLASHPSTADNIAAAVAHQFVGPQLSKALIDSLAATFRSSGGATGALLRAVVQSPEFWRHASIRQKQKSPFEYAVSALRAAQADVRETEALRHWIADMGQPLYAYLDANGVPANKPWINAASLGIRVKFALQLSAGEINGVALPKQAPRQALAMQIAGPQFQVR